MTATGAAAVIAGMMLGVAPASAAPAPITPAYPLGQTPPDMTAEGVTAEGVTAEGVTGMVVTAIDGTEVPPLPGYGLGGGATYSLAFRDPANGTVVVPPAARGTITMAVSTTPDRVDAGEFISPAGPQFGTSVEQPPSGTAYGDSWVIQNNLGTSTYRLDFTGLTGGALPAGTVLAFNDVDVCGVNANEAATMTSSIGGTWARYYADTGRGTPGTVTADPATGQYALTSRCPTGANGVTQTFVTTQALPDLTFTLTGNNPNTTPVSGLWWALELPVTTAAADVALTKLTNNTDVPAAPGPTLTVGDPVTWQYRVRNTGNTNLTDVTVTDDQVPDTDITCPSGTNTIPALAVREQVTCTAAGTVTDGQYQNTGTVTGVPSDDAGTALPATTPVTATDTSWYTGTTETTTPPTTPPATPTPTPVPPAAGGGTGTGTGSGTGVGSGGEQVPGFAVNTGGTLTTPSATVAPWVGAAAATAAAVTALMLLVWRRRRAHRP